MGEADWDHTTVEDRECSRDEARAALIACRDDMVAEAVKAEAEACAKMADDHARAARKAIDVTNATDRRYLVFGAHEDAGVQIAIDIRARHP